MSLKVYHLIWNVATKLRYSEKSLSVPFHYETNTSAPSWRRAESLPHQWDSNTQGYRCCDAALRCHGKPNRRKREVHCSLTAPLNTHRGLMTVALCKQQQHTMRCPSLRMRAAPRWDSICVESISIQRDRVFSARHWFTWMGFIVFLQKEYRIYCVKLLHMRHIHLGMSIFLWNSAWGQLF